MTVGGRQRKSVCLGKKHKEEEGKVVDIRVRQGSFECEGAVSRI